MNRAQRLASSTVASIRELGSARGGSARSDPLSAAWRFLQAPGVWYACFGAAVVLLISAVLVPRAYIGAQNAFGWPVEQWPGGYQRLVALILLGSTPWSKAVLAALAVVSVVRAGSPLPPVETDAEELDQRTQIHSEREAGAVRLRLRLAAALFGYRLQSDGAEPAAFAASSRWSAAISRIGSSLSIAALALMCLAAPKFAAAEVIDLEAGYPVPSVASGLLLFTEPGPVPFVVAVSDGQEFRLRRGSPLRLGDFLFAWHGSGPALEVAPVGEGADAQTLIVPFLPDEQSKYIAVPEMALALRASLTDAEGVPSFRVQPLTRQGQPAGEAYEVADSTEYLVPPTALRLTPTWYQVVSVARLPFWWAGVASLVVLAVSLAVRALDGQPLRLAIGTGSGVTTAEVLTVSGNRRHQLLLRLARLLLR